MTPKIVFVATQNKSNKYTSETVVYFKKLIRLALMKNGHPVEFYIKEPSRGMYPDYSALFKGAFIEVTHELYKDVCGHDTTKIALVCVASVTDITGLVDLISKDGFLVALPDPDDIRRGSQTWKAIHYAQSLGIPVEIIKAFDGGEL